MKKYFLLIFLFAVTHFSKAGDFKGKWYFEIDIKGIGNVRTIMDCESDGTVFTAATPPSALGLGSLVKITNGTIAANEVTGKFVTPSGSFNMKGELEGDSLTAFLYDKQNNISGSISAGKTNLTLPLSDYKKITEDIFAAARKNIFNEEILQTGGWQDFERTITSSAKLYNDDIDIIFSFYINAMKVPVSHLSLLKETKSATNTNDNDAYSPQENYEIKNYGSNTVYLKISSFTGKPEEIDSLFKIILDTNPQNLILDLRDNAGGSLGAGLRTAQYLAESDAYGGIFLTRSWFDKNKNAKIPLLADYGNYDFISVASNESFNEMINKNDALTIKLTSLEKKFNGKLFILTNNKTASTCEPFVAGLKQNKNTSVIGEKTAGKMMQSEKFPIGQGFILTLPTSDFYTPDGIRLEGKGVKPAIETASDSALTYTLDCIKK